MTSREIIPYLNLPSHDVTSEPRSGISTRKHIPDTNRHTTSLGKAFRRSTTLPILQAASGGSSESGRSARGGEDATAGTMGGAGCPAPSSFAEELRNDVSAILMIRGWCAADVASAARRGGWDGGTVADVMPGGEGGCQYRRAFS